MPCVSVRVTEQAPRFGKSAPSEKRFWLWPLDLASPFAVPTLAGEPALTIPFRGARASLVATRLADRRACAEVSRWVGYARAHRRHRPG